MGRVRVGAVLLAIAVGGCGSADAVSLHAAGGRVKLPTISTSTPTLLPVAAGSQELNCPFHDGQGGQGGGGVSFQLR